MLNYILTGAGGIIFLGGYYYMSKNRNTGTTMRIYALGAYAGFCMMVLGGTNLLAPVFMSISSTSGSFIRTGIQVALFVVGAELFLKPAFEDQDTRKSDLTKYAEGSVSKPVKKKPSKKTGSKVKNQAPYQKVRPTKPKNNPKKKKK